MFGMFNKNKKEIAQKKWSRSFGGKTENLIDEKEKAFEKAHLAAYLRGKKTFSFGKDEFGNKIFHKVKIRWKQEK